MTTHHHKPIATVFYRPEMALAAAEEQGNFSKSPSKPRRFMERLLKSPLAPYVRVEGDFEGVTDAQLRTAHTQEYVEAFFRGEEPYAESNGLRWSEAFAATTRYTSGSLLAATRAALAHPEVPALSPTSGFHHARPDSGEGFCTFSGQVVAALEVYRQQGARCAWVDLDGHFGNSIEDSRTFAPDLDQAIPLNLNPAGRGQAYLESLEGQLLRLEQYLLHERVDYVCFAHGADSHEWDDLRGQLSTQQWLLAAEMVYGAIARASARLGRPVPVVMALFGGYRADDPNSVLELHLADLAAALRLLGGAPVRFQPCVQPRRKGQR